MLRLTSRSCRVFYFPLGTKFLPINKSSVVQLSLVRILYMLHEATHLWEGAAWSGSHDFAAKSRQSASWWCQTIGSHHCSTVRLFCDPKHKQQDRTGRINLKEDTRQRRCTLPGCWAVASLPRQATVRLCLYWETLTTSSAASKGALEVTLESSPSESVCMTLLPLCYFLGEQNVSMQKPCLLPLQIGFKQALSV